MYIDEELLKEVISERRDEIENIDEGIFSICEEYVKNVQKPSDEIMSFRKVFFKSNAHQTLSETLKFYHDFDLEIYRYIANIILNNSNPVKIVVYNDDTKESLPEDERFPKYTPTAQMRKNYFTIMDGEIDVTRRRYINSHKVYIKLINDFLTDSCVCVHELAHTLDINESENSQINEAEDMLAEVISLSIERIFKEYLMRENPEYKSQILGSIQLMNYNIYGDAEIIYTIMQLLKSANNIEDESISNSLDKICNENTMIDKNDVYVGIVDCRRDVDIEYLFRYVIGNLVESHVANEYNENPDQTCAKLKKYCEAVKAKMSIWDCLACLGVDINNLQPLFDEKNEEIRRIDDELHEERLGEK